MMVNLSVTLHSFYHQDAAFNKTSRSLQELQQKELGVKPEFRSELHHTVGKPPHLTKGGSSRIVCKVEGSF